MRTYNQENQQEITELLLGRKVTKVDDDKLTLDNGRVLTLIGNDGGCACSAGNYDLTELNGVDNIITRVEFENNPTGDDWCTPYEDQVPGFYKIFVYASNNRINLATFEGSDGNGYYGTGYAIMVEEL